MSLLLKGEQTLPSGGHLAIPLKMQDCDIINVIRYYIVQNWKIKC